MRRGGVILAASCLLMLTGCGSATSGQGGSVKGPKANVVTAQTITQPVTVSTDGRVLHTKGYAGGCRRGVRLSATEKAGEVILKLEGIARSAPPCPADARWLPVQVTLAKPVGHRTLIDGTSTAHLRIQGIWRAQQHAGVGIKS